MNEIQNIDTLTVEILILKQQTAQNIIEIGKRLVAVKESLPHGEFGSYLKEKVAFSERTAQNFMKVAREFSNTKALADLEPTKVYALLDLPIEEREEFVSVPHEINGQVKTVEEMTTRELQKTIKERDAALKTLESAKKIAIEKSEEAKKNLDERFEVESKLRTIDKVLRDTQMKFKSLENALQIEKDNLKKEKENSKEEIAKLQSFIGEAKADGNNEEVERLQASLSEIQGDLDSSALKIDELEAQLKEKPVDVTETIVEVEKIPDEIAKELQNLREKDSQNSDQSVIKFKRYYENLQSAFTSQLELIDEIKDSNPKNHEKFKNAISKLISKMSERL